MEFETNFVELHQLLDLQRLSSIVQNIGIYFFHALFVPKLETRLDWNKRLQQC